MSVYPPDVLVDPSGQPIGKVTDVIPDPVDLEPEWLVVRPSRFGKEYLVPLIAVEQRAEDFVAPFDKDTLTATPVVEQHTAPTVSEREAVYRHFGLDPQSARHRTN
jgi:hypothetical protein